VGGGADGVIRHGAAIAEAEKIFWLQLVGTGITAAWSVQLAAVLTHARWPAVNCHQLYTDQIARPVMQVEDGYTTVPDTPGLGVQPDLESVEKYRTDEKPKPYPAPNLLIAVRWPSGGTSYYSHTMAYWDDFKNGKLPLFVPGVYIERVEDDGSREWSTLCERVSSGPVHSGRVGT
jgi:galactonate dehydratase